MKVIFIGYYLISHLYLLRNKIILYNYADVNRYKGKFIKFLELPLIMKKCLDKNGKNGIINLRKYSDKEEK